MMCGLLFTEFKKELLTVDIINLNEFELVWCLDDPTEGIDSMTEIDDIDDWDKLMAKEKAFLDTL